MKYSEGVTPQVNDALHYIAKRMCACHVTITPEERYLQMYFDSGEHNAVSMVTQPQPHVTCTLSHFSSKEELVCETGTLFL